MLGMLNDQQIDTLLYSQVTGRIGCHGEGKVYIVPVTYAFDGDYIYCHSHEGMKIRMMRENPNVCFEVEQITNMANWQTAIIWGAFEELSGNMHELAMQRLMHRLTPLIHSETSLPGNMMPVSELDVTNLKSIAYRIKILEKTGRYEKRIL